MRKKWLKEKTGTSGVWSLLSEGPCKVELKFAVVMLRSHRHCVLLSPAKEMGGKKKLPSFDIQIIFKYSNKKLVLCRPFGSLSTIRSSPPFSSSLRLLCISSPTERVSTLCYFKANAAWGPFQLSQAAACSVLVQPAVGTRDYALCLSVFPTMSV